VFRLLDEKEFDRWIRSSIKTIESSKKDLELGEYSWACFKAHQAAEKALKALLWGIGSPGYGHSLPKLIEYIIQQGIEAGEEIRMYSIRLNKFYTATRYPDVWSEGIPEEYYTREEAEEAIEYAEKILEWVRDIWRKLSGEG